MHAAVAQFQNWMPDIEGLLGSLVKGTNLLQGGAADYWLMVLIAVAFPVGRLIMDRTVYDVSLEPLVLRRLRAAPNQPLTSYRVPHAASAVRRRAVAWPPGAGPARPEEER